MPHVRISQKVKKCFNVKSSTYSFHLKAEMLVDFQICISVPLTVSLGNDFAVMLFLMS